MLNFVYAGRSIAGAIGTRGKSEQRRASHLLTGGVPQGIQQVSQKTTALQKVRVKMCGKSARWPMVT